jgi:hypothetical protein
MQSKFAELVYDIRLLPGETLRLPEEAAGILGPGHWLVSIRSLDDNSHEPVRDHTAFLNSYSPEDDGLYDDYSAG